MVTASVVVEDKIAGYVRFFPAGGEGREEVARLFGVDPEAVEEANGTFLIPVPSPRLRLVDGLPAYVIGPGTGSFLWLAQRFLGDALRWPSIWPENRRREVSPGLRFAHRPRVLRDGWIIRLPVTLIPPEGGTAPVDGYAWAAPSVPAAASAVPGYGPELSREDGPEAAGVDAGTHEEPSADAGANGADAEPAPGAAAPAASSEPLPGGPEAAQPETVPEPAPVAQDVPARAAEPAGPGVVVGGLEPAAEPPVPAEEAGRASEPPPAPPGPAARAVPVLPRLTPPSPDRQRRAAGAAEPARRLPKLPAPWSKRRRPERASPTGRARQEASLERARAAAQAIVAALEHGTQRRLWPLLVVESPQSVEILGECLVGEAAAFQYAAAETARALQTDVHVTVLDPTTIRIWAGYGSGRLQGGWGSAADLFLVPAGARDGAIWYVNLWGVRGVLLRGDGQAASLCLATWVAAGIAAYREAFQVLGYGDVPPLPLRPQRRPLSHLPAEITREVLVRRPGIPRLVAAAFGACEQLERVEAAVQRSPGSGLCFVALEEDGAARVPRVDVSLTFGRQADGEVRLAVGALAEVLEPVEVPVPALVYPDDGDPGPEARGAAAGEAVKPAPNDTPDEGPAVQGTAGREAEPQLPASEATFQVRLLGRSEVLLPDGSIMDPGTLQYGLLLFLILKGGTATRDEILEALYPGESGVSIDALRSLFRRLRQSLVMPGGPDPGEVVTLVRPRVYRLALARFEVDLDQLNDALDQAARLPRDAALPHLRRVAALYRGDLCTDQSWLWLEPERQRLQRLVVTALLRGAAVAREEGNPHLVLELLEPVLSVTPWNEEAVRLAMRAYGDLGDTHGVRKAYGTCVRALAVHLDQQPSPETVRLYHTLLPS